MGYVPFFAFVFVSWPSLEEDWPFEGSACDDRIAGVAGKQAAARNAGIWMDVLVMKITLAAIVPRRSRTKSEATDRLLADYVERAARYLPCDSQVFDAEAALLEWLEEAARAAGASRIRVEARMDNEAARSFYNERGYHEGSIVRGMYSGQLDGVRLVKWLRAADAR